MKLQVNDIAIYYEVHGEGKPVLFSHGWLDDCSIWDSQVKHFASNYTVILYDQRGHGKTDTSKGVKGNYSVQVLSNDIHSLVQKLSLDKLILVGFSLGGMAAMLFALDHPDKISKLVLVGTTAKMTLPLSIRFLRIIRGLLPYETFLRMSCKYKFYKPSTQNVDEEFIRASKVDNSVAFECWKEFTENYDIRDKVSQIKIPTLIIVGEKDKVNLESSRYLNQEIKGSELHIITDSGHLIMIEKTQEFNQILEQFIS
jgi:pimeloyl-ACP methyl ester carboxylesterase